MQEALDGDETENGSKEKPANGLLKSSDLIPKESSDNPCPRLTDSSSETGDDPCRVSTIPLTECPFTNAIFKELSIINGKINSMKRKDLKNQLKLHRLNHKGDTFILRKRLKNYHRVTKLTNANLMEKQKLLSHYVVIDFEATCQENNPLDFKFEIIEFPAILVSTETLNIVDVFHSYVKPVIHPRLSPFCKKLTGITQDQVNAAPVFSDVMEMFHVWLDSHNLLLKRKFIVTDGPWDMGRFLYLQCKQSKVEYPTYAKEWINLRKIFRNFYKYHQGGNLESMIEFMGLTFEGEPHRGLDDALNIARMFIHLLKDGALIRVNERITPHNRSHDNVHVVPVPYNKRLNNFDDVKALRKEIEKMNIKTDLSDTEPSEENDESDTEPSSQVFESKEQEQAFRYER